MKLPSHRKTLHKNHVIDFVSWLNKEGWIEEETKGVYEVIRARNKNASKRQELFLAYWKHDSDHLTFDNKHSHLVRNFLNNREVAGREGRSNNMPKDDRTATTKQ